MAQWPGEETKWYRAQIFSARMGTYGVYYPDDSEVARNVEEALIKPADPKEDWVKMKREHFVKLEFDHVEWVQGKTPKELGKFKVVEMGKGKHVNKYVCVCVESAKGKKGEVKKGQVGTEYKFDMGYVQKKTLPHCFPFIKLD